jgi:peptidoglycan/xylan/chitin deacetylase (PgdA/CDA1 family)
LLSKDGLVFTFDDGYRDAFEHAAPILAANNIRGVFYVTAAPFCWQNILWNDVVGEFCETVTPADATAVVAVSPEIREMVKNVAVRGEKERKAPSEKLFLSLLDMDQEERESIVADFRTVLDKKKHEFAPSRLLMSGAQIAALASRGHEIGAHTVSHSRLSRSAGRAGREIVESVRELRSAGIPVSSFAYPFGRAEDIDPQQTSVLSQAGISNAVTTEKDLVAQGANHFLLPRITVLPYHTVSFIVALFELLAWKRLCVSFLFRKQASSLTTVRVAQARQ